MKNFLNGFFEFITGGFFNYIGAAVRVLFSKKKYQELVQEPFSNYMGMFVLTIILFIFFLYIKLS